MRDPGRTCSPLASKDMTVKWPVHPFSACPRKQTPVLEWIFEFDVGKHSPDLRFAREGAKPSLWRLRSSALGETSHSLDSSAAAGSCRGNFQIWRELTRCSERSFPPPVLQLLSLELSSASAYIQVPAEDPTQPPEEQPLRRGLVYLSSPGAGERLRTLKGRGGGGPEWRGCPLVGRHHVNYAGWLGEREEEAVSRATGGQGEAVVAEPGLRSAGQSTEQDWLEAVASEAGVGAGRTLRCLLGVKPGRAVH